MEYSNLYTSGLRVMAQNDRASTRSSSSRSLRNFLPLHHDSNREEPGSRGPGRITSLPARLFRRAKSIKDPNSPSYSVPSSRKASLDTGVWRWPSVDRSSEMASVAMSEREDDEESIWHARNLLKTGHYPLPTPPLTTASFMSYPPSPSYPSNPSYTPIHAQPRRPLPAIPTPPPTPYVVTEASPVSPQVGHGTSFLYLSPSTPSSSPGSSTPTINQSHSGSRPSSVHSNTVSIKPTSRRSSRVPRDDLASVLFTEEVQDWRRFYFDMALEGENKK